MHIGKISIVIVSFGGGVLLSILFPTAVLLFVTSVLLIAFGILCFFDRC